MPAPSADRATGVALPTGLLLLVPLVLSGNVIGSLLRDPDVGSAVLFPPYAVLTAALVMGRRRDWVWYILTASLAHFVTHWPRWSVSWVLLADVANIARAMIAAALLRWVFAGSARLDGLREFLQFCTSAVVAAPAAGALIGGANAVLHGASPAFGPTWIAWFVSNALTGLVMLPACIVLFDKASTWPRRRPGRARLLEALGLAVTLAATCAVAFLGGAASRLALPLYTPVPALIWAALSFGSGGASLALTAVAFSAIWSADRSAGPFTSIPPVESVLALQIFVLFTSASVLCLSAVATARRQAQVEIEEHRREVSHLSRVVVLGQLSGAIAHELNQPLAAILSNAEAGRLLLRQQPVNLEELELILRDIAAEDQRAAAVIQRLRALFKRGDPRLQQIDARELISDVLLLAQSELIARQITASTVIEPNLRAFPGDKVQLQQVLLNLILNACEAMTTSPAPERRLILTAKENDAGHVHIATRDFGSGIPPALADRLFEPFVTSKPDGLGLGLSVSRTIVTAHGGRLWAETHPDGGTTMHTMFPLARPAPIEFFKTDTPADRRTRSSAHQRVSG